MIQREEEYCDSLSHYCSAHYTRSCVVISPSPPIQYLSRFTDPSVKVTLAPTLSAYTDLYVRPTVNLLMAKLTQQQLMPSLAEL